MPKRRNPKRKLNSGSPRLNRRKYIVKNRARNYDSLARMSTYDESEFHWTSVENSEIKEPFVFEPFSTDPKKHAAVFAWIDQMLNGNIQDTPKKALNTTTSKPPNPKKTIIPKRNNKLRSRTKKPKLMRVKIRPRKPTAMTMTTTRCPNKF